MAIRVKIGPSEWRDVVAIRVKTAINTWQDVVAARVKTAINTWQDWWGNVLAPANSATISKSPDPTTYLITLTGRNYSWSPTPTTMNYYFEWSTNDGVSWTTLSSGTATNPAFGSSTTYTHAITTSQLSANVVNTYRFRVYATYNTQTATSAAVTTIQGPTDITLTAGTATDTNVPINWTASTGAGRYLVQYKLNASPTWTTYSWVGTTYETIYGLTQNSLYNVRVTPYTSLSNDSTYKAYAGNTSNVINVQTAASPGSLTKVEHYNFYNSTGQGTSAQGFFTTGTNTTRVSYYFKCTSLPTLSVPTYNLNTTSGTPYKVEQNLLSYFTLRTWSSLTTYFVGDYVLYNNVYYFCKATTTGNLPTNTTYWIPNSVNFQIYITPYNVDIVGTEVTNATPIAIWGDTTPSSPLRISVGPTISNATSTSFRVNFTPSVYTNYVDLYISKNSDYTSPTGYNPKTLAVAGATATWHDTQTALTQSTAYTVTMYSRYTYSLTPYVYHQNNIADTVPASTTAPIPDPPTGLTVTDIGTNRPYNNAAYNMSWTAPINTGGTITGYKISYQVPSVSSTWFDYSANATDTSSTSITVTGFSSNVSYNFRVFTVSTGGTSATAVATASPVLATTVPQAPTIGAVSSINTYISVTYTAPSFNGGKAITSYTATSSPGSLTGSTTSGAIQIYNVVHNQPYTITVTATNANGTSLPSAASGTVYGVNIGSIVVTSSSSTSTTITLNFTRATLYTSPTSTATTTRGYLNNSLDASTTATSYTFSIGTPSTQASLGLAAIATVNGITYEGPRTTGNYSTSAAPAVSVNSYPTISGTGAQDTNITFGSGSYNNASTITKTLRVSTSTSFSTGSGSKGSISPYTITASDAAAPAYYFATLDTVVGTNGLTYYYWSGGYSGASATIPAGSGSILSYPSVAPTISGSSISPTSGTAGSTSFTASATASGTPTPTLSYQWQYFSSSSLSYVNIPQSALIAGSTTSSTCTPVSNFNTLYPNYGFYCLITATNSAGSATARPSATLNSPASGTAPATPTGVGLTGSGSVSWTGDATATSYEIEFFTASDGSGSNAAPNGGTGTGYTVTGISSSPYQLVSPYGGTNANWARVRVRARNSAGASAYSAWVPSSTTYT